MPSKKLISNKLIRSKKPEKCDAYIDVERPQGMSPYIKRCQNNATQRVHYRFKFREDDPLFNSNFANSSFWALLCQDCLEKMFKEK